jgi:hypothetical protein
MKSRFYLLSVLLAVPFATSVAARHANAREKKQSGDY